jgi:protein-L-isoaspartate(D-aspartate) O-methyltransferase
MSFLGSSVTKRFHIRFQIVYNIHEEKPMRQKIALFLLFLSVSLFGDATESYYEKARKGMVKIIEEEVDDTEWYTGRSTLAKATLLSRLNAYENRPLSIGYGQTISQPYIVAIMTDLLDLKHSDRVLEIGTGSAYQAAVLAKIVKEVYTIEVIDELGVAAAKRLKKLGYKNINTRIGDGYYGWKEHAPYDRQHSAAAS